MDIKVYGLVGKSGTGKSYQADALCDRMGIEGIIDDGLFISEGRIMAGTSAKRRDTKIGAIKAALFSGDAECAAVAGKIREVKPASLLIIGTSDDMVLKIAKRLGLPAPGEMIRIEDLTTPEERQVARERRIGMGEHVIPAPTMQIKKDFSGYFIHPIKSIKNIGGGLWNDYNPFTERDIRNPFAERTVVRPTFSYLGKFSVSDRALSDIAGLAAAQMEEVDSVYGVFIKNNREGAGIELSVILKFGCLVTTAAEKLQTEIKKELEKMTAINILSVDITVKGLMKIQ